MMSAVIFLCTHCHWT